MPPNAAVSGASQCEPAASVQGTCVLIGDGLVGQPARQSAGLDGCHLAGVGLPAAARRHLGVVRGVLLHAEQQRAILAGREVDGSLELEVRRVAAEADRPAVERRIERPRCDADGRDRAAELHVQRQRRGIATRSASCWRGTPGSGAGAAACLAMPPLSRPNTTSFWRETSAADEGSTTAGTVCRSHAGPARAGAARAGSVRAGPTRTGPCTTLPGSFGLSEPQAGASARSTAIESRGEGASVTLPLFRLSSANHGARGTCASRASKTAARFPYVPGGIRFHAETVTPHQSSTDRL